MKRLKFANVRVWNHHYQGWKYVIQILQNRYHHEQAILFESAADRCSLCEDWVGFVHGVPRSPAFIEMQYGYRWDLTEFLSLPSFKFCRGLWTLSSYTADFLKNKVSIPVSSLKYPASLSALEFIRPEKVVMIGHWLRDWQQFYDLSSSLPKFILKGGDVDYQTVFYNFLLKPNASVQFLPRMNNYDYDCLLATSVVFLPLFDAGAVTTIVECIMRNVPVITSRLPASIEYLGSEYPLFFSSLEEASALVNDSTLLAKASEYLRSLDKSDLTIDYFISAFEKSTIFSMLADNLV